MGHTISIHLDPIETELYERMRQHVSMSSTIWIILRANIINTFKLFELLASEKSFELLASEKSFNTFFTGQR